MRRWSQVTSPPFNCSRTRRFQSRRFSRSIVAILSGVTAGATILSYPGGTAAPGFWVSYTTTAFDFPTSGRYEVSIVATLAGIMRVTAVIPLVVDASANSS